jgi:hypothetical protein
MKCFVCSQDFLGKRRQKYCSPECFNKSQIKKRLESSCVICNKNLRYLECQGKPVTCGGLCLRKLRSLNTSGQKNPGYGKFGKFHPAWGSQKKGNTWRHSEESKEKQRKLWLERTNNGSYLSNLKFKQTLYTSRFGRVEFSHSSYETKRMKFLDSLGNVHDWTKKHGVKIPYYFDNQDHIYVPDFKVVMESGEIVIEEIKGFDKDPQRTAAKIAAAISFCEDRGWKFKLLKLKDLEKKNIQQVIFLEGPDNCGKSHIGRWISHLSKIPYVRFSNQHELWGKKEFKNSLEIVEPNLASFVKQTSCDFILDRSYASEFVYSKVFARETNEEVLDQVDKMFSELGTIFLILLRRDYSSHGNDIVIPDEKLLELHQKYLEFVQWTRCSCVIMYVDDFKNDLLLQGKSLLAMIKEIRLNTQKKIVVECHPERQ